MPGLGVRPMSFQLKRRKPEPMGVKEPTVIRCDVRKSL